MASPSEILLGSRRKQEGGKASKEREDANELQRREKQSLKDKENKRKIMQPNVGHASTAS